MRAVILAAGKGTRMGKYTENLPKGMLNVEGKTLIERQIETLRMAGISDIAIVTGYEHTKINYEGVKYFHNAKYDTTNMVESLMCAKNFIENNDVLVCYSDILYTENLVKQCINADCNIGVAVDEDWKKLWQLRYGKVDFDLESLTVKDGNIIELGREVETSAGLDYRYIGIIKFTALGIQTLLKTYNSRIGKNWKQSGKNFEQGYMTDILAQMIDDGNDVKAIISNGNWLEFDTSEDYETLTKAFKNNQITKELTINNSELFV